MKKGRFLEEYCLVLPIISVLIPLDPVDLHRFIFWSMVSAGNSCTSDGGIYRFMDHCTGNL